MKVRGRSQERKDDTEGGEGLCYATARGGGPEDAAKEYSVKGDFHFRHKLGGKSGEVGYRTRDGETEKT